LCVPEAISLRRRPIVAPAGFHLTDAAGNQVCLVIFGVEAPIARQAIERLAKGL